MDNVLQKGLTFGLLSQCRGYYRVNFNNAKNIIPQQLCGKPVHRKPKRKRRMKSVKRLRRSKRKRAKSDNHKCMPSCDGCNENRQKSAERNLENN